MLGQVPDQRVVSARFGAELRLVGSQRGHGSLPSRDSLRGAAVSAGMLH